MKLTDCNLSGIILEGISGTGKSTVLRAMLNNKRWVNKSCLSAIVLSEHHTQRVLENKEKAGNLDKSDNIELLSRIVGQLEFLKNNADQMDWLTRGRSNQIIPFILERFHLTHVYHYPNVEWEDVAEIDARLQKLGARVCLLIIDDKDIENRIVGDRQKNEWQQYLARYGKAIPEIVGHFIEKQNYLVELARQSSLAVETINTSKLSPDEIAEYIFDWWEL